MNKMIPINSIWRPRNGKSKWQVWVRADDGTYSMTRIDVLSAGKNRDYEKLNLTEEYIRTYYVKNI